MIVIIGLFCIFVSVLLESLIYLNNNYWKHKAKFALSALLFNVLSVMFIIINSNGWLLLVAILAVYKQINLGRIIVNKLPDKHLKSLSARSFVVLTLLQAVIIITWQVIELILGGNIYATTVIGGLLYLSLLSSILVFITTLTKIYQSSPKNKLTLSLNELPTVSVCIPARNETPTLTSCLNSVIASEYPKLEILVLDDDSQDTTAEIIRSFANKGVRFIRRERHTGEWLAKNNAYQTLLEHASGEVIFFMGVDVRLHKNALNGLVEELISRELTMMTVFPRRTKSGLVASFVQPIRYWWELALPKIILKRQPALSTSWMVMRQDLLNISGFKTYKRSIIPEEHLARFFDDINKYGYIRTNDRCRVTTHKNFLSQWDTAVRTRYPHAHRRPENVLLASFIMFSLVLLPFLYFPFTLSSFILPVHDLVIIFTVIFYLSSHVLISAITNPVAGFLAPLNFPIAILLDVVAMHISMFKYEFSKVVWKGRDVGPHKLKVYKSLPKV